MQTNLKIAIVGAGIGAVAGSVTPWFFPLFIPTMPLGMRAALAGVGVRISGDGRTYAVLNFADST